MELPERYDGAVVVLRMNFMHVPSQSSCLWAVVVRVLSGSGQGFTAFRRRAIGEVVCEASRSRG
jgi:hypothetical protein